MVCANYVLPFQLTTMDQGAGKTRSVAVTTGGAPSTPLGHGERTKHFVYECSGLYALGWQYSHTWVPHCSGWMRLTSFPRLGLAKDMHATVVTCGVRVCFGGQVHPTLLGRNLSPGLLLTLGRPTIFLVHGHHNQCQPCQAGQSQSLIRVQTEGNTCG